jgi:hypothetical protein
VSGVAGNDLWPGYDTTTGLGAPAPAFYRLLAR